MMLALLIAAAGVEVGPPDAVAANNAARDAWGMCIMSSSAKYADLSEPAETIADAAVSNCTKFEPEYRRTLDALRIVDGPMIADETKDRLLKEGREVLRQHAVGTVLDIRLAKSKKTESK
jgi:hypothetical protein